MIKFTKDKEFKVKAVKHLNRSKDYEELVEELIRERYSLSQELAILRQRDTKPNEYDAYNTYAEECKARARELLEKK